VIRYLARVNIRDTGKFNWSPEADQALQKLKSKLASDSVIFFPDFSLPFTLVTDASKVAMGYALMQVVDGKARIVRINSKTFNQAQQNYSATERECLGVTWAVIDCRNLLRGCSFTVKCDHRALTYLDTKLPKNDKLIRWSNLLSQFDFVVQYLPGCANELADYFSRPSGEEPIKRKRTPEDDTIAGSFENFHHFQIYVPSWITLGSKPNLELCGEVLHDYHDNRAHPGAKRMQTLMAHLIWPSMIDDIAYYTRSCVCHHRKGGRGTSHNPELRSTRRGTRLFEKILVDFIDRQGCAFAFKIKMRCDANAKIFQNHFAMRCECEKNQNIFAKRCEILRIFAKCDFYKMRNFIESTKENRPVESYPIDDVIFEH
jgi:hypothetical protein